LPAEASIVSGAAGRYATALFDLAKERRQLDAVASDLDGLARAIEQSADLARLIRNPLIDRRTQGKAMAALGARMALSPLSQQFLGLVAAKRRLQALPAMIRAFRALLAQHRGEVIAEVVSATPLSAAQLEAVKAAVTRVAGKATQLTAAVDPALIGGLVVTLGSRRFDASLRGKLRNLEIAMKEVA